jgi:hypothetical protein
MMLRMHFDKLCINDFTDHIPVVLGLWDDKVAHMGWQAIEARHSQLSGR